MHTRSGTGQADPSALFIGQFAVYVLLMGLAYSAQSGLLKALGNVYAVVIFGIVGLAWVTRSFPPSSWSTRFLVAYSVYIAGIACSIAVNPSHIDWGDLVKISLVPAFLVFGAAFERARLASAGPPLWKRNGVRVMVAMLVLVPLFTWAAQLIQSGFEIDGVRVTSIFANRNNAAVYAVTLLAMLTVITGRPIRSIFVFLLVGVMFGTLGVLVAVIIALTLTVAKPRDVLILAVFIAAGFVGYFIWPDQKPFVRFTPVIDSVRYLLDGRIQLQTVTFADLVLLLKTQDLSFIFRLKHWDDMIGNWTASNPYHWLFGFGVGSTLRLTDLRLVAHNDFLRLLFEFGLVTLVSFVAMLTMMFWRLGRRWETVPLLAVAIYLISENLINNYTAMAFFFFSGGVLAERMAGARQMATAPPPR